MFTFEISWFIWYCFKFVYNLAVTLCLIWMRDFKFIVSLSPDYWFDSPSPLNLKKLAGILTLQPPPPPPPPTHTHYLFCQIISPPLCPYNYLRESKRFINNTSDKLAQALNKVFDWNNFHFHFSVTKQVSCNFIWRTWSKYLPADIVNDFANTWNCFIKDVKSYE